MQDGPDPAARAAAWAARRTDPTPLSPAERAALDAWLATDLSHSHALAALEHAFRDPHLGAAAARVAARDRRRLGRRAAFSLGVVAATGGLWLCRAPIRRALADEATEIGEVAAFDAGPGARITLDTASAATREGLREWRLTQGAARLDLAPGASLALSGAGRVEAEAATVVLRRGTAADRLSVLSGRARVEGTPVPPGHGLTLTAAAVGIPGLLSIAEHDAAEGFAHAWRRFEDAPLSDVLTELARYRAGPVWAATAAERLRVTGRYRFVEPEGVLAAIAATMPVRIQRLGPAVRVTLA